MKQKHLLPLVFASALAVACGGQHAGSQTALAKKPTQATAAAPAAALDPQALLSIERDIRAELDEIRNLRFVGMDDGPVPDFDVRTADGSGLSSKSLVG